MASAHEAACLQWEAGSVKLPLPVEMFYYRRAGLRHAGGARMLTDLDGSLLGVCGSNRRKKVALPWMIGSARSSLLPDKRELPPAQPVFVPVR